MPEARKTRTTEISIIGAGRLGTTLAIALAHKGYSIRSLVSRTTRNALKAASRLDAGVQVLAAKNLHLLDPADVFLITTPDDQIREVAAKLSRLKVARRVTALHTSGALSAEVLAPLRHKGWSIGSIHPLISVSSVETPLRNAFWCVEGDTRARGQARRIVRDLEGKSFSIRAEDKALYHAAAVMSSGNVVALFDVALELLIQCGLTRKTARNILLPLLASTISNLQTKDPVHALTGTFSRGDIETVKRHLKALKRNRAGLDLYRLLGKRSLKLSEANGLDHRFARRIEKELS
jgi:predicted short-subunit dehydrogenase-like oxidoreductase (DUF2520 family)